MGVSGCGKTTIGKILSVNTGIPFFDGDDFHQVANIQKMKSGLPLDDNDRSGWLSELNSLLKLQRNSVGAILACSALKQSYRKTLLSGILLPAHLVFLNGSKEIISRRLQNRSNHYMPLSLLDTQFEILEPPEESIVISIEKSPEEICCEIQSTLSLKSVAIT